MLRARTAASAEVIDSLLSAVRDLRVGGESGVAARLGRDVKPSEACYAPGKELAERIIDAPADLLAL